MVEKFSGPGMLDTDSLLILPFGVYGYSWLILYTHMYMFQLTIVVKAVLGYKIVVWVQWAPCSLTPSFFC